VITKAQNYDIMSGKVENDKVLEQVYQEEHQLNAY
jgi:hypothetical protein